MFNSPWIRRPDFARITKSLSYDDYWRHRGWRLAEKLKPREKIMLELIPQGARILDIGCGNSALPLALIKKGCEVAVADISPLVIDEYKKRKIQAELINLNNLETVNFKEKIDYIILSEVLEHQSNPEEVIERLKNFTSFFIITIPNSAAYQFRYGLMFRGRFFTQWVFHPAEHLRFWSHIDFLDWLRALNLDIQKVIAAEGFSFRGLLPWLPNLWKNFLGFRMIYLCKVRLRT